MRARSPTTAGEGSDHAALYDEGVSSPKSPLPVPPELQVGLYATQEEWSDSGRFAVELLCRVLGRGDLSGVELLDVGCGTKLVKTLLESAMPIGRYVGIDASSRVIEWLDANVCDSRFEFHHLDARNAMYNPDGADLGTFELLPVGQRRFDVICLFSVFTHLAPHDYIAMLRLLRRHATPDATLLFSLFLNDPEATAPFRQAVVEGLASEDREVRERMEAAVAKAQAHRSGQGEPGFVDEVPDRPLLIARYDRDYALQLVGGTGWEVRELHAPERFIQHYMVCAPI
jgi:SAM-dependent methyltransferase